LGPDVLTTIDTIADRGHDGVVIQAVGFVADHLETLYDLDVEARRAAESRGLRYSRAAMPNDDPAFVDVLAGIVEARL
jgi:ferrochelatase